MANPKPKIREKTVGFRCSEREAAALETLATIEGRTVSETLREAVREVIERRGLMVFGNEREVSNGSRQ